MDLTGRPDIVHAHVYEAGLPAIRLGRRLGVPVVVTEHSSDFPAQRLNGFQLWKARHVFERATLVLPVSQHLGQTIASCGIEAEFAVVPNVVDPALFYPPLDRHPLSAPLRLLFVGSLIARKGLDVLLAALEQAHDQLPDWHLDIVGQGKQRQHLEELAERLHLGSRTTFHGRQLKSDVAGFMRAADLLVLPSLAENAPCVLIEAMACGLPVLASRVGGVPEIVDPASGRLVHPGDVEGLARALTEMIETLPTYSPLTIVQRAQRYSPSVVGSELDLIYRAVIS
jgi:glycosyltransferase involved in cell wall biosynthesis